MSGGISAQRNIAEQAVAATSVEPQSSGAATIHGGWIDRYAHGDAQSCILHQAAGAISGSPSASSITSIIEDSVDGSTLAGTVSGSGSPAALTAQNTESQVGVDLSAARRYVRITMTVAFTGGTSPAALVYGDLVFGGEQELPAT